jgi:hypothetical protein
MLFYIRFSLPMMITIAVADLNQTYCQGLKTMLEQVEGFSVVFIPASCFGLKALNKLPADILLVDEDLYQSCQSGIGETGTLWPVMKTIVLTMDRDEIGTLAGGVEAILKGSGKLEFTERIMKLTTGLRV